MRKHEEIMEEIGQVQMMVKEYVEGGAFPSDKRISFSMPVYKPQLGVYVQPVSVRVKLDDEYYSYEPVGYIISKTTHHVSDAGHTIRTDEYMEFLEA